MLALIKQLLYPSRCILCDSVLSFGAEAPLCGYCRPQQLMTRKPRCVLCSRPLEDAGNGKCRTCFEHKRTVPGHGAFIYEEIIRTAVHRYKYEGRRDAAQVLAMMMVMEARTSAFWKTLETGAFFLTYVPVHPERKKVRGYDQAQLLAQCLAQLLHVCVYHGLRRASDTAPLKSLGVRAREKELQDAFIVDGQEVIPPGRAVLIDDIYTSGSTVEACSKALKALDPKREVLFWTFAIRPEQNH